MTFFTDQGYFYILHTKHFLKE